ncbi:MAG TPA: Asp23/Gls24 family envelope stress response protein, partial [Collinsella sp.]|nr:Asp23/Gls24 family envelope stress response protein [Collinsella sp.]
MAFNTKVDVADTELEANGAVAAEAEDVTLEDEALVEAESDADEDNEEMDEEADESEDSLTYSNGVIEKIVAMATREVPHVLGMKGNLMHFVQEQFGAENLTKGVTVEVTDDNRVVVNISVIIEYGAYAPAIFDDVKARVTERLAAMTGLEV